MWFVKKEERGASRILNKGRAKQPQGRGRFTRSQRAAVGRRRRTRSALKKEKNAPGLGKTTALPWREKNKSQTFGVLITRPGGQR